MPGVDAFADEGAELMRILTQRFNPHDLLWC
jgi:hypothetical protein